MSNVFSVVTFDSISSKPHCVSADWAPSSLRRWCWTRWATPSWWTCCGRPRCTCLKKGKPSSLWPNGCKATEWTRIWTKQRLNFTAVILQYRDVEKLTGKDSRLKGESCRIMWPSYWHFHYCIYLLYLIMKPVNLFIQRRVSSWPCSNRSAWMIKLLHYLHC